MATCGYICPSCDGREIMDDGSPCTWCKPISAKPKEAQKKISDEDWMQSVHFGTCCSDPIDNSCEDDKKDSERK